MTTPNEDRIRRVLVVDDDRTLNRTYTERLRRIDGLAVSSAFDGTSALAMIEEQRSDLVLLDLGLPDLDGLEVLRRSREPGRHQSDVIVITGDNDGRTVLRALRTGAISYLVKPFSLTMLCDAVSAAWRAQAGIAGLAGRPAVGQSDVDNLVSSLRSVGLGGRDRRAPKGIASGTLDLVRGALTGAQGDLSAMEVAQACGLSRASARRYLQHLVTAGLATERLKYGGAGRPEHRYAPAGA